MGMLREVIESEHQVFVFKLVVFLLATVEIGGKDNALRFLSAGGATILVPLIVLSLSKVSQAQCSHLGVLFKCYYAPHSWKFMANNVLNNYMFSCSARGISMLSNAMHGSWEIRNFLALMRQF